jgi:hypothetical protein
MHLDSAWQELDWVSMILYQQLRQKSFLVERMPSSSICPKHCTGPTQFRVMEVWYRSVLDSTGPYLRPEVMFNLEAPTTSINS